MLVVSIITTLCGLLAFRNGISVAEQAKRSEVQQRVNLESAEHMRDLAIDQLADLQTQIENLQTQIGYIEEALKIIEPNITIFDDGVRIIKPQFQNIGEFIITAYCPCEKCCGEWSDGITASGIPAEPGVVAVDPNIIPLGSTVIIDGQQYLAADTGGAIKGNRIDIFAVSHDIALEYGVQNHEVYLVVQEEG